MVWTRGESEGKTPSCWVKGKDHKEGHAARQWLDDVKEWTGLRLNEMCREPEDHMDWRKRVIDVAQTRSS